MSTFDLIDGGIALTGISSVEDEAFDWPDWNLKG
jgi:hypothetical protein